MNFDRVARGYRLLERIVFRGALQEARGAHLDQIEELNRVLLLGDGDGRFLQAFLECNRGAQVDVVEASAKMVELSRDRVAGLGDVRFHCISLEKFEPVGKYDLIASHFFLDCFDTQGIERVARRVRGCLAEHGLWLIADFQVPERGIWRCVRAIFLLKTMYLFFRFASGLRVRKLVDPDPILEASGFVLESRRVSNLGFIRSDRWVR